MRRRVKRNPGWLPAAVYAVALHAALLALLFVGFRAVSRPTEAPTMQATIVRDPSPDPDNDKPRREEERKRKEVEVKKAEDERKRQEAAEQARQESERKKQEEEALEKEKKKQEQEKRKHDEEEKKQQVERKKQEKERQKQAEQTLREQLAEEEKGRSAARKAKLAPEVDKYRAAIRQKVERNWIRPSASRKDLQCTVRVRLIPGGEVLEAKIVRSSGDPVFDRSVENAVHKASPLPLPENAELLEQFREIEFIFRPED
jgi:colicin import membrane protein